MIVVEINNQLEREIKWVTGLMRGKI